MGVSVTKRDSVDIHVVSRPYESIRFLPFLYNIILLLFNALNLLYWWHRRDLKAGRSNGSDRVQPDVIWRRIHHERRDGDRSHEDLFRIYRGRRITVHQEHRVRGHLDGPD